MNNIPFISGLHTIVAKSKDSQLDNLYKKFCFQSEIVKNQFIHYAAGTKVCGINKRNIKKIHLPIPPVFEQRAIATILSDMDAEIEALEKKHEKLQAVKKGMMQELLTGRVRLI